MISKLICKKKKKTLINLLLSPHIIFGITLNISGADQKMMVVGLMIFKTSFLELIVGLNMNRRSVKSQTSKYLES